MAIPHVQEGIMLQQDVGRAREAEMDEMWGFVGKM
jgi:hypothetical protein